MNNITINFPETEYVGCTFSYKTEGNRFGEMDSLKKYYYKKVDPTLKLKVGDTVVVNCATGFQVVKVSEINALVTDPNRVTAYIVGKVDIEAYELFLEREAQKARLAAELKRKKKELEGLLAYELIAEKDAGFAEMLKAFKELGGTL